MIVEDLGLGVLLFRPDVASDHRGRFLESWHSQRYGQLGRFVQDNVSLSERHVLRGLHFQHPKAQGKLVTVLDGTVFDVAVDIRRGSPTFGSHVTAVLTGDDLGQLWIPPGFAHGFLVTSDRAIFSYKCTDFYDPACEGAIAWNDPRLAIPWPLPGPVLSPKDASAPPLDALDPSRLPVWPGPALSPVPGRV